MTLNGHFTLNSVFAHVRLEYLHEFFENCVHIYAVLVILQTTVLK